MTRTQSVPVSIFGLVLMPQQGEVGAVGRDEAGTATSSMRAGDKVLLGQSFGTEVTIDGQTLLIMKESNIMGIVG